MKKQISVFVISLFAFSLLAQAEPFKSTVPVPTGIQRPVFSEKTVYRFEGKLEYAGPVAWVGVVQKPNHDGTPLYILPPSDKAVFLKYDPKKSGPERKTSPMVEVMAFANSKKRTALQIAENLTSKLKGNEFIARPKELKIKGVQAAVTEYKLIGPAESEVIFKRKLYVLILDELMFFFQLTSADNEYSGSLKEFDESVQGIKFKDELDIKS